MKTKLTADERAQAIADFVDYRYPNGDAPEGFLEGCTVLYGEDGYQVVDADGHGDGSGAWTPVKS